MSTEVNKTTPLNRKIPSNVKESVGYAEVTNERISDKLKSATKWPFRVILASVLMYGAQNVGRDIWEYMHTDHNLNNAMQAAESEPHVKALLDAQEIAITKHFASLSPEEQEEKAKDIEAFVAKYINLADFDWRGKVDGVMSPDVVSPDGNSFNINGTDLSLATLSSKGQTMCYTVAGRVSVGDDGQPNIIKPVFVGSSRVKGDVNEALGLSRQDAATNIMAALARSKKEQVE